MLLEAKPFFHMGGVCCFCDRRSRAEAGSGEASEKQTRLARKGRREPYRLVAHLGGDVLAF
jgi:hypothetical protein